MSSIDTQPTNPSDAIGLMNDKVDFSAARLALRWVLNRHGELRATVHSVLNEAEKRIAEQQRHINTLGTGRDNWKASAQEKDKRIAELEAVVNDPDLGESRPASDIDFKAADLALEAIFDPWDTGDAPAKWAALATARGVLSEAEKRIAEQDNLIRIAAENAEAAERREEMYEQRIAELQAAKECLCNAATELADSVDSYRTMYEGAGPDDIRTGRCWDLMRRATGAVRSVVVRSRIHGGRSE